MDNAKIITRPMIVEFGKMIFNNSEIERVVISISFKDGSEIHYGSKYKSIK